MAFKTEEDIVLIHSLSVINNSDQPCPATLYFNFYVIGPGIEFTPKKDKLALKMLALDVMTSELNKGHWAKMSAAQKGMPKLFSPPPADLK